MEKLWKTTFLLVLSTTITACATQSGTSQQPVQPEKPVIEQPEQKPDVTPDVKPEPETKPAEKPEPPKVESKKTSDGRLILGEKEWVYIPGLEESFRARVDTGATTSSISAVEIVPFERDGKDWVKFKMEHDGVRSKEIALPVERWVKIKQSSAEGSHRRAVVYAWIEIGDHKEKTEFTLADRTHLSFPVLLGRSFFRDVAVVDVSRKYVQDKHK
ncbi:ATP-dependent zinc protease family protein [Vibrio panuliri]|uniref:ATP-dependent Zn protease n=1 Tax=Vibrio panuliri TaxID=1381081 RepID=A0A1Q9HA21_9VIBR|nr:ATP-dependent zinc protease [Vibrio panuliri]KAB1457460.1 ATP-dependent Zn protease [Vibrio panuliri]OLQ85907.1 ATP-dependent Zn protease [Vibrio panuliri]OLQ91378.1 ATP-dependent Zn protease [Vibrio panuliri]